VGTIRRYTSRVVAEGAAEALRAAGIIATVVGDADALAHIGFGKGFGDFAVVIREESRKAEAARILAELEAEPPAAEAGWEESAAAPDLSRLDPSLEIPCVHCGYDLRSLPRSDAGEVDCPECGGRVDLMEAIVARHGPEGLSACYAEEADPIPDEVVDAAVLDCRGCQYSLAGLPQVGNCPECGLEYSKRRLLRG